MHTIDARGRACPQPVLLTRNALREYDELWVIVDNDAAQHNVARLAQKAGHQVTSEERDDGRYLHIVKVSSEAPAAPSGGPNTVVLVGSDSLGRGDPQLGTVLIRGFLHTLTEMEDAPATVILVNRGVHLVAEGSRAVEDLCSLRERGTEILACGTCLKHYELIDKVAVGTISNMYQIAETLLTADKVVST
jgi:selenium metabolism protein YedF